MSESKVNFFMPISKVDKEKRIVYGYASTPSKDSDGEIITLEAVSKALPGYMQWRNIREMHKSSAVGVAEEANMDDRGLFLRAKIVDDAAWKKCLEGVYKGFSIGGRKLKQVMNKVTELELTEISVVDRPANPDAVFAIAKVHKDAPEAGAYLLPTKSAESKAIKKMAAAIEALTKAGPPAAHDGLSLPADTAKAEEKPVTKTRCEAHDQEDCQECLEKGGDKPGDGSKPYGDVKYADNGLQPDGKKRYPIDTEEHIRAAWNYINKPKNAAKYGSKAAQVKSAIVAAWKEKIDASGPPSAKDKKAKKMKKAELAAALGLRNESFLILGKGNRLAKGMSQAGSLAYTFDSIRGAQRSLMLEGKREGGDGKDKMLAQRLGTIASDLADVISLKAKHEGQEALDLSDADDLYVTSMLGDEFQMSKSENNQAVRVTTGDPLVDAAAALLQKAAQPTRAMRMAKADEDMKQARRACKAAKAMIEEAHKMHKAAFLAKAAKKDGKEPDGDEFDHAGAMEKLQKAYNEIDKARTFGKAARVQLAKAASRAGQRGQEVSDSEAGFYEVPAGVKDLSPAAMAGAAPGTTQSMGEPQSYPGDGSVYMPKAAGTNNDLQKFAKDGAIPAEVAELILAKARAEGELEALRKLPAAAAGARRPYAFDLNKVNGAAFGSGGNGQDLNKTLFNGVNVNAIGSGDERAHTQETAKVIGNFLTAGAFGKSVLFDPNFKGMAGGGKA